MLLKGESNEILIESVQRAESFIIDQERAIIDDDTDDEDYKSDHEGAATSRSHDPNEQLKESKK